MLLIGLQMGGSIAPWNSSGVISLVVIGTAGFGVFLLIEWRLAKFPLMPLSFFATVSRLSILSVNVSQSFITTGCTYFLPLYFQIVLKASSIMSGVYFLPTTVVLAVFFICVGHIVKKSGEYRLLIQIGTSALVLGAGLCIRLKSYSDWPIIIISQIILAMGLGLTYQAPLIAFHAQVDDENVADATSTFQFLKTLSQTVSVILSQVILQNQTQKQASVLYSAQLPKELIMSLSSGNVISTASAIRNLTEGQQEIVHSVLTKAFNDIWIFYVVIASLGFLASFGIVRFNL